MKIISKFHDYYDSALSMGRDESIHYIRHTTKIYDNESKIEDKELIAPLKELFESVPYKGSRWSVEAGADVEGFNPIYFFFCGKIYIAYQFTFIQLPDVKPITETLYSVSQIEKILKRFKLKWETEEDPYSNFFKRVMKSSTYDKRKFKKKNLEAIFEKYKGGIPSDLNIKCNSPILVSRAKTEIISNPRLADYNFVCLFDPYTAFQEISMFVGGVIGSQKVNIGGKKKKRKYDHPIVVPKDDKVDIERHGFDYKYSFRKAPEGKKVKRKREKR